MSFPDLTLFSYSKEVSMAHVVPTPFHSDASAATPAGSAVPSTNAAGSEGSKTLAAVLLAASLSALLVVADRLIETWTDGNLLVGWVALWTVTFAGLSFLARPLRRMASALAMALATWVEARRVQRLEDELWEFANHDRRVMSELEAAYARQNR